MGRHRSRRASTVQARMALSLMAGAWTLLACGTGAEAAIVFNDPPAHGSLPKGAIIVVDPDGNDNNPNDSNFRARDNFNHTQTFRVIKDVTIKQIIIEIEDAVADGKIELKLFRVNDTNAEPLMLGDLLQSASYTFRPDNAFISSPNRELWLAWDLQPHVKLLAANPAGYALQMLDFGGRAADSATAIEWTGHRTNVYAAGRLYRNVNGTLTSRFQNFPTQENLGGNGDATLVLVPVPIPEPGSLAIYLGGLAVLVAAVVSRASSSRLIAHVRGVEAVLRKYASKLARWGLIAAGVLVTGAAPAASQAAVIVDPTYKFKITNKTGVKVDDLDPIVFSGTGGVLDNPRIIRNPANAGQATIGRTDGSLEITWAAPGFPNGATVEFQFDSPGLQVKFEFARWTIQAAGADVQVAQAAAGGDVWDVMATNNTGTIVDAFTAVFLGTGDSIQNAQILSNPPGAGTPAIAALQNTIAIDWGAPGLLDGQRIAFRFETDSGPVTLAAAEWAKNVDPLRDDVSLETVVSEPSAGAITWIVLAGCLGYLRRLHRGHTCSAHER